MGVGAILLGMAWSTTCALTAESAVVLKSNDVHISDVVSANCLGENARRWGSFVIATLPRSEHHISRAGLANLIRRRMPAMSNLRIDRPRTFISFRVVQQPPVANRSCFSAARSLSPDEEISGEDVGASACDASAHPALRYDAFTGVTRATAPIAAGEYLGPLDLPPTRYPRSGDALILTASIGAARVERPVIAVQSAPRGGAVFVRDANGEIFSAPLSSSEAATP